MPAFYYEAVNTSGQRSSGTLEAADRGDAVRKLTRRGLQPFSVKAEEQSKAANSKADATAKTANTTAAKHADTKAAAIPTGTLKLSRTQVIQFTEDLCDLLTAGLQLVQALHAMENRNNNTLRTLANQLRNRVQDGVPFSTALHQVSPSFGDLYCNLVAAGEAGGALHSILKRQVRYLNQMETLRARVSSALIYPSFIIASGVALAVVFVTYLLPKLAVLIQTTSDSVPAAVTTLLAISQFLKTWWWLLLAIGILCVMAGYLLLQQPANRKAWHRISLKMPIFGPVLQTRFEVQFLETLGNLLKNGLPLHRGLELVRRATVNMHLSEQLTIVEDTVHDGNALSRALEKSGIVRPTVIDMVRVGEQTGEMAEALEKAADRFDRQLAKTLDHATALLQPMIMLFMAAMVGGMAWMMINIVFSTLQEVNQR